jgi:hypothetical protein
MTCENRYTFFGQRLISTLIRSARIHKGRTGVTTCSVTRWPRMCVGSAQCGAGRMPTLPSPRFNRIVAIPNNFDRLAGVGIFIHREKHQSQAGHFLVNLRTSVDPVKPRHRDVEHNHVRPRAAGKIDERSAIAPRYRRLRTVAPANA